MTDASWTISVAGEQGAESPDRRTIEAHLMDPFAAWEAKLRISSATRIAQPAKTSKRRLRGTSFHSVPVELAPVSLDMTLSTATEKESPS